MKRAATERNRRSSSPLRPCCHSRESGNPDGGDAFPALVVSLGLYWIPAFAGMTVTGVRQPQTKRAAPFGAALIGTEVRSALTLGELEALAGLGLAVLLAFHHATVAGQEACLLDDRAQQRLIMGERLGDAVLHRASLAGKAAAGDGAIEIG